MDWGFCDSRGNISKVPTNFQLDGVGNIVQRNGGVNPKACQVCKEEFKSEIKKKELTTSYPSYVCNTCDFHSAEPDKAFDHKLETDHKISKKSKVRVAGYENISTGKQAHIKFTDNDCIITCGECAGI
jgi:hypothetical protein